MDTTDARHHPQKQISGIQIRPSDWIPPPNLLSLARLLFAIPAVVILAGSDGPHDDHRCALLLILSFATDGLDGLVARAIHLKSDLGKILDPVIDKLVVLSTAAVLVFSHREPEFPLAVLIAMALRDFSILTLAGTTLRRDRHLFTSRMIGKTTMFVVAATLLSQLISDWLPLWIVALLPWLAFALLLISSVDYLAVYLKLKRQQAVQPEAHS